jgi:hypothetical protein
MRRRRSSTSIARYSGCVLTTREEKYGNAARSVSALVLYSPQHALGNARMCTCGSRTTTHIHVYGRARTSGRLVPPRLRRTPHLLTEYRRDSYMATVCWMHGEPDSRACASTAVNPETRCRSLFPSGRGDRDSRQLIAILARGSRNWQFAKNLRPPRVFPSRRPSRESHRSRRNFWRRK